LQGVTSGPIRHRGEPFAPLVTPCVHGNPQNGAVQLYVARAEVRFRLTRSRRRRRLQIGRHQRKRLRVKHTISHRARYNAAGLLLSQVAGTFPSTRPVALRSWPAAFSWRPLNASPSQISPGSEGTVLPRLLTRRTSYAPNFSSRPACAMAKPIRYLAGNCPSPPVMQSDSPNASQRSGRQRSDHSSVGTGCQL
jgi:hypothetical protein